MIFLTIFLTFKSITIFYDNTFYLKLNKLNFNFHLKNYNYLLKTLKFLISRII